MEETLTALGISGPTLGAVVWYLKARIMKYEKRIDKMTEELKQSTSDNSIQKEQITRLQEDIKELRGVVFKNRS